MIARMLENAIIKGFDGLTNLFPAKKIDQRNQDTLIKLGKVAHPYHPERMEEATLDIESRMRHVYVLGSTGTGKSRFIQSLVQQDILLGNGCAVIDPHGDLTSNILNFLAKNFQREAIDKLSQRLVVIEPFNREYAIGFNPLAADGQHFAAMLELLEIFHRYWSDGYWGPRMDEVLRNTLITLCVNNLTLLEARPLLTDETFRAGLVENIPYAEVRDYWQQRYNPLSEKMQALYREPILNKISAFVTDPAIYRILGQRQSTINFRQVMDQGKWVLLNMSKGQLKENMGLLGMIFLTKLKQAALSRIDIPESSRRPFFLYVDEFQSFVKEDMETTLSEARKFRFSMTMAHQNLEQLPVSLRASVLGNVGTGIFFCLSHRDASLISSEIDQKEKPLIEKRLIDLKVGRAYLKIKGQKPRLLRTTYVPSVSIPDELVEEIKLASFRRWSRPVIEVEQEISERKNYRVATEPMVKPDVPATSLNALSNVAPLTPLGAFEEGQSEW
jgi:hypothetical protein